MKNFKKRFINLFPFIFFSVIVIYTTRNFLFKNGYILYAEFSGSNDYIFFLKNLLNAWTDYTSFGYSNIGLTTSYGSNMVFWIVPPAYSIPLFIFFSVIQAIFGTFGVKIYFLLSLIFPFLGMFFFAQYWFKKISNSLFMLNFLSFISALIYTINPLMGDRIAAGHLKYNLAHGLFLLLFLFNFKAIEEKYNKKLFLAASGLIIGILIGLMPHLITLYLIVMGFYFLIFVLGKKEKTIYFFGHLILSGIIGLLLNIHVWLPAIFFSEKLAFISDPTYLLGFVYNLSSNTKLIDLITIISSFEQTFISKVSYEKLIHFKYILPILGVIGLFFYKERRKSLFLLLVGLIGLIFSLGINSPFEKIYLFLFKNFFLFKSLREPGKFNILYILSISLLAPYIFFLISRYLNKTVISLLLILFVFFILYVNPNFTTGNFGNTVVPFIIPGKYNQLRNFLSKSKDNFRVALYPNDRGAGDYRWMPQTGHGSGFRNLFLLLPLTKDLANSNNAISDWTSRYLDYIESNLGQAWAVERLGEEMTRYLIIDESYPDYEKVTNILRTNQAVRQIKAVNGFTIFELKKYNNQPLNQRKAVYYFGNIKGIEKLPADMTLINVAPNSTDILSKNYSDTIILYNSSIEDAFYTTLDKFNFSFYPEVRFTRDTRKEFYSPGNYLRYDFSLKGITFYNPEIIRAPGNSQIKKTSHLKRGKYKILLSSLSDENQTNGLKITVDDIPIIKSNFRKKNETIEWVDFGEIEIKKDKPAIALYNLDDKPLSLDYLLIIPIDEFNKLKADFYSDVKSKTIVNLKENDIIIKEALAKNKKQIYILSQSFSPYWKICNNSVFRVNFYGTGVVCAKDTKLNPQFTPQFLYQFSIVLSGIFYVILFYYMGRTVKYFKKTKS